MNAVLLYVLAIAARRFGVRIHVFCALSNHVHLVVTDPHARLPAFAQYFGSLVARATNVLLGRGEAFWAPGSYSAVRLESPDDVVAKAAYALTNPVAARLVRSGGEWPGLRTAPDQIGDTSLTAARPRTFFRSNGYLPAEGHLELAAPPGFASAADFRNRLTSAVRELEEAAHDATAGRVLGAARVLAQKPQARPALAEPRRELNPRIAARDKWKRIEALCRLGAFLDAYRAAWAELRQGLRDVEFPAGTYRLRVMHGVRCAEA